MPEKFNKLGFGELGAIMNQATEYEITTSDPIIIVDGNFFSVRLETTKGTIRLRLKRRAIELIANQLKDLPRLH